MDNRYNTGMNSEPLHSSAAMDREGTVNSLLRGEVQKKSAALRWERILLSLWFIVNLALGALTVRQYGVSFDEPNNYRYAADTLAAYKTLFGILGAPPYNASYDGHGPAFMAGMLPLIRGIQRVIPSVFQPDLFHFSYFIAFQLTGLCLYLLMRRWFHIWTAWGILILFDTQPLLLGHAFINPKDIPFMLFFTLSILLGFRLADRSQTQEGFVSLSAPFSSLMAKLREAEPVKRRRFFILLILALALALFLTVFSGVVDAWVGQTAKFFYHAAPDSWAGRIFSLIAANASQLAARDYASKAQRLFQKAERFAFVGGLLLFLAYFGLTFPAAFRTAWEQRRRLATLGPTLGLWVGKIRSSFNLRSLRAGLAAIWQSLRQPRLLVAGVVLGLATSVRAVAPWAGVITFLYLLSRVRSRAWATGIAYFLVAGLVGYLTWPRLWGAPLQRYWAGIHTISNFVDAQHVLFNGQVYPATGLPASYVFTLLNIQFTEPLLALAYIGLGILAWQLLRGRVRTDQLLYVGLAFAAPLIGWSVVRSPLYDNLRQVLFIFPAMFMLAALTLEWIFGKLTQRWLRLLLITAIVLPGVYSSIKLYPYEYNYYNSLVGGLATARKLYPMDPWQTSLREVALALNQRAPQGATVLAGDWAEIMSLYARPDLTLIPAYSSAADLNGEYDYAVEVANVKPWSLHHETENVFTVSRDGAVFATLKAVNNSVLK